MRNYNQELKDRVEFIQKLLKDSNSKGIVYGNSGGKDSALTGILCKKACENTVGLIMPCGSKRNYIQDKEDGMEVADKFGIETHIVDLTPLKDKAIETFSPVFDLTMMSSANINPRLRMIALYAYAQTNACLVAGTDNKSEMHMGYFTKWGDGGYDFNPIGDLTVTEVYEFLRFLEAPSAVIEKAPSAALFEGQTDEDEMGITYAKIDNYITNGIATDEDKAIIDGFHERSEHKRHLPISYEDK